MNCLLDPVDSVGFPVPMLEESVAEDDQEPADTPDTSRLVVLRQCCQMLGRMFFMAVAALRQLRQQVTELRSQANYWQAQHQRAVQREAELKEEKQSLHAQIRELKQRLFGRKAETSSAADPKSQAARPHQEGPRRHRGQQRGAKSHGRRNHDHLTTKDEPCTTLPEDQRCCPYCQEPLEEIPGTADGDILECEVRGYRRRYHRQRYRRH